MGEEEDEDEVTPADDRTPTSTGARMGKETGILLAKKVRASADVKERRIEADVEKTKIKSITDIVQSVLKTLVIIFGLCVVGLAVYMSRSLVFDVDNKGVHAKTGYDATQEPKPTP